MFPIDTPGHSREACTALLSHFLLEPAELLAAWAPGGWERSPLHQVFHPPSEQLATEQAAILKNLQRTFGVTPALEDDPAGAPIVERPVQPEREVIELLGLALWDVFSDNNTVHDRSGMPYALGSFRSSAGFIADAINERYPGTADGYSYIDFYMGTMTIGRRADLTPVYSWIFERLRGAGCDWAYTFPRVHVIHFDPPPPTEEMIASDPSEVIRAELAAAAEAEERWVFEQNLREAHNEAVLEARAGPPPTVVSAYARVFGGLPEGWPPPFSTED